MKYPAKYYTSKLKPKRYSKVIFFNLKLEESSSFRHLTFYYSYTLFLAVSIINHKTHCMPVNVLHHNQRLAFSRALAILRKTKGYKREYLAQKIGLSCVSIYSWSRVSRVQGLQML